jgi:hypothetical protein
MSELYPTLHINGIKYKAKADLRVCSATGCGNITLSAIIITNDMKLYKLIKYEKDHIQATNISIENWDGSLTITAFYCPPRHSIKSDTINSLTHYEIDFRFEMISMRNTNIGVPD